MNLNITKQKRDQSVLCTNCNKEISLSEYSSHKDDCYYRQTFNKSNKSHIDKEHLVIVDPNYSSLSSLKKKKFDEFKKNKEDPYKIGQGYFNMNDAAVTFGAKRNKKNSTSHDKLQTEELNKIEENEDIRKNKKNNIPNQLNGFYDYKIFGLEDKLNDNNSYCNVIIQVLWSMKKIKTHIINDIKINSNDVKNCFLFNLQKIFLKIENNYKRQEIIIITDLRKSIAESFQSRRKFLLNYPDDPVDLYFAVINSLHSYKIKSNLNEIKDTSCDMKCAAHKYVFMDISRKDHCECKGSSKRLYSYHNYILDIPLKRILDLTNNSSYYDDTLFSLKGSILKIYRDIISNIKTNCPEKGSRCTWNKTKTAYYLTSSPEYICFNLQDYSPNRNLLEILKTIILIPTSLNLSCIFSNNQEKYPYYQLISMVCISANKHYTCVNKHGNSWFHFEDEIITTLCDWNEVSYFILKRSEVPLLLFYEKKEGIIDDFKQLTNEDIELMILYYNNMSRIKTIFDNKFRPSEYLIKFDDENEDCNRNNNHKKGNLIKNKNNDRNLPYQCNVCGVKIIHSNNSNFTCFCSDHTKAGNFDIGLDQNKTTIESTKHIENNPSKTCLRHDDKILQCTTSPSGSEKEKIRNSVAEKIHKIQISKDLYNHINNKATNSGSTNEQTPADKKGIKICKHLIEMNLPKQMDNKHIIIKDESIQKKMG